MHIQHGRGGQRGGEEGDTKTHRMAGGPRGGRGRGRGGGQCKAKEGDDRWQCNARRAVGAAR